MKTDESGQVGGLEALVFGVVLFVLGGLVIAQAWGVIDAKIAASGAARVAARAMAQAPAGSDLESVAAASAAEAMREEGRDPTRMTVTARGALARCQPVTARVSYRVPLLRIPLLRGIGSGFVVSDSQEARVDPYRDGLKGMASCAAG